MRRLLLNLQRSVAAPTRNPRLAVVIGRLLAIAFLTCFATGLYSHFLQEPLPWMRFATQPAQLYQVTQGIHITAGIACFPLILGKLYTVFPNLFQSPPITGLASLFERASITIFVAASLVEITIGLLNTYQFYPWPFGFREVHFALSFVIIGSLAIHIGIKLPIISRYWRKRDGYGPELVDENPELVAASAQFKGLTGLLFRWIDRTPIEVPEPLEVSEPLETPEPLQMPEPTHTKTTLGRRGFLVTIGGGVAAVVLLTAGQSFAWLAPFNLFAPRQKGIGPQAVPINRTAKAAQVTETAMAADWKLTLSNGSVSKSFTRADLLALPQTTVDLPISCVEGWSQMATWSGVRLTDLVKHIDAGQSPALRLTSLEKEGGYRVTQMGAEYVGDPSTLVALTVNGSTLDIDHGYPARIIAPGRPGVLQTKWLSSLEVMA